MPCLTYLTLPYLSCFICYLTLPYLTYLTLSTLPYLTYLILPILPCLAFPILHQTRPHVCNGMVWYGMVRPSKANGIRAFAFPFPFSPTLPYFLSLFFRLFSPFLPHFFFPSPFSLSSLFSFFPLCLSSSHCPRRRRPRRIVLVLVYRI